MDGVLIRGVWNTENRDQAMRIQKMATRELKREASEETNSANTFNLVSSFQCCERIKFCSLSNPVGGILS